MRAGLRALAHGQAHLAGSHLLDADGQGDNRDAVAHWRPTQPVRLITLIEREQGLLVAHGNPLGLQGGSHASFVPSRHRPAAHDSVRGL
ncbi:MAG: hypothetical protein EI684_05405 [Candidatus Viridilinea halotolerans]|uniref:PBP domain-containing protein n=1 Tax=Candidatus Viridilinea halotolerans TaxID=2491704 RepID=A0A426U5C4_9CHLR|nr:MAG: hypothetical protein EI684_05405 [Candidatus Viridilinea halotolerans]